MRNSHNPSYSRDILLLCLALAIFFAAGLGARPYLAPSEARYIEIPRQILATGDWLTPRLNGVPYFEKPPLFYWMQAAVMGIFGINEFTGRIIPALSVLVCCALTYITGRQLYGRQAGLLGASALGVCLLGYGLSRIGGLDAPLAAFITATLSAFTAAQLADGKKRGRLYLLMYVFSALAVMTKGLIGIVIPGLVIGAFIVITRKWHILKEARLITGLALFLIITLPWHLLMQRAHPEFFNFYIVHEHFERYTTDEHKRTAPAWFFLMVTTLGWMPFTLLMLAALKRIPWKRFFNNAEPVSVLLGLWIILPLVFFSASHSKLVPYIFPIFPPLAMLLGAELAALWQKQSSRLLIWNAGLAALIYDGGIVAYRFLPLLPGKAGAKLANAQIIPTSALLPAGLACALFLGISMARVPMRRKIAAMYFAAVVGAINLNYVAAVFDQTSIKLLAAALTAELKPEDSVYAYHSYWQDLPVYLNRNISVVEWNGELYFGVMHYPETRNWMIDEASFWKRCSETTLGFYVMISPKLLADFHAPADCPLEEMAHGQNAVLLKKAIR